MRASILWAVVTVGVAAGAVQEEASSAKLLRWPRRIARAVAQDVETTSGTVRGTASKLRPTVSAYLGIPYAQPPVGALRWAPPQRASKAAQPIDGSKFGPGCLSHPETVGDTSNLFPAGIKLLQAQAQQGETLSEDCLTINVWAKSGSTNTNRAVILFLPGESYDTGSTAIPIYDGSNFADEQDIIFATANWRLNIFGFPGAASLSSKNLGLLDQRMAVEWVRDNIKAFGGDPTRIILMGESAAADSIDMYTYTYASDPIIAGGILQSGIARTRWGKPDTVDINPNWATVASSLGCTGADDLACMRQKDGKVILAAVEKLPNATFLKAGFEPVPDNKTRFADYNTLANDGKFAKIPMIIGNNDFEAGLFRLFYSWQYEVPIDHIAEPVWEMYDSAFYSCPAGDAANYRQQAGLLAYRYRYFGSFDNTRLYSGSDAYHTAALPVLFGTAASVTDVRDTPAEFTLGYYLRSAWASFAKLPAGGPTTTLEWPKFNALSESLIRLGYDNQTVASTSSNLNLDASCASVRCAAGILAAPKTTITMDNFIEQLSKHFKLNPRNGHVGLNVTDLQFQGLVRCGILQSGPPLHKDRETEPRAVYIGKHKVEVTVVPELDKALQMA